MTSRKHDTPPTRRGRRLTGFKVWKSMLMRQVPSPQAGAHGTFRTLRPPDSLELLLQRRFCLIAVSMSRRSLLPALSRFALLLALSGCGGGDDSGNPPPSDIGTLAYVTTACRDSADNSFVEHQSLHILHGDRDVTVVETPEVGPIALGGLCQSLTLARFGDGSILREAFQGVAVSPDGTAVVFEATDDFSISPRLPLHLPPEQKGIFVVGADGTSLRSLGPPSRLPSFFLPGSGGAFVGRPFAFSPDGRMITFVDKGPDAAGNEAGQVWTLDVGSGRRRQVTQLPPAVPPGNLPSDAPSVVNAVFIDNQTIGFLTFANPDGMNTGPPCSCPLDFPAFTVSLSDGIPKRVPLPVTSPDSRIIPTFVITGDKPTAVSLPLRGKAQNGPINGLATIGEVFVIDGLNLLQLTNFQRVDTSFNPIVDVDRQAVFFEASANPPELHDSNPFESCQIFSIDRLGGNLRQLTQFSAVQHTTNGCLFSTKRPEGCVVNQLTQDSETRTVVFLSSCDPLRTNPFGTQLFAMRPDGSDLRQLTYTQGVITHPGVEVIGELPGPFAYGPYAP